MILNSDDTPHKFPQNNGAGIDISFLLKNIPTTCIPSGGEGLTELLDFCKSHNIIGLNFKHISNPKQILKMLKDKMGIMEIPENSVSKTKSLLKG